MASSTTPSPWNWPTGFREAGGGERAAAREGFFVNAELAEIYGVRPGLDVQRS